MATDRPLKDLLDDETLLSEYYLLRVGLELVLKELELNGEIKLPDDLTPEIAKGLILDLLREDYPEE